MSTGNEKVYSCQRDNGKAGPAEWESWLIEAQNGNTIEAIEQYISYMNGAVSFVEIERMLAPYVEVKGDVSIGIGIHNKNIIFWAGLSEKVAQAIIDLEINGKIHFRPTNTFVYLIDGKALTYPIAKRPPKKGYKDLRWLPVCLYLGPGKKGRFT